MKYSIDKKEEYVVLCIEEENMNSVKAPELKSEIILLHSSGIQNLVIDLSSVKFIDSSGLSAILTGNRLWQESGGMFVLAGIAHPSVKTLITISRLDSVLTIREDVNDASKYVMMEMLKSELSSDGPVKE